MKKKILVLAAIAAATATTAGVLTGCGKKPAKLTDSPLTGSYFANFTEGEMPEVMCASDGWTNGDVFNTVWSASNVNFDNGALHLSISENSAGAEATNDAYFGGEVRSYQTFGYGDYTVKMKPAKKVGTASTFFTYSGPESEDDDTPWDEIDIEFLGKDTTKVQFNYFVNGVGGHEYMYNLGFDASEEYHEYGYRWTAEYIVWFVDGNPVYKVEASNKKPLPSTPGKILMNYWCGTQGAHGWMGEYSVGTETSDYQWIKTSATPIGELPEKVESSDVPTTGWVDIDYSSFGGWTGYTVDKTNGLTVSHTAAMNGWKCEGMDLSQSYSWVKFNIKNNENAVAALRVDIKQKDSNGGDGIGGVAGVYCEEEGVATYDAENFAATIKLEGEQSADVVLKIKDIYVNQLVIFLNSMQASGGATTGSVTITDLKGIVNTEVQPPEEENPEIPPVLDNGESLTFTTGNANYVIDPAEGGKTINVKYSNIMNEYSNIAAALGELAKGKSTFTFTVVNNGEKEVVFRVDLRIEEGDVLCNTEISADGGDSWKGTPPVDGNYYFKAPAGKTVNVTVTYSGNPDLLLLYIDSTIWEEEKVTKYSGDVTLGNFSFSGTASTDPGTGGEITPEPNTGKLNANGTDVTFSNSDNGGYTISQVEDTVKVTYEQMSGSGYNSILTGDISAILGDNDILNLTIKNNGADTAKVRIDIIGTAGAVYGNFAYINKSASYTGGAEGDVIGSGNDYPYGGADWVQIKSNGTVICKIVFATGAGANKLQLFIDSSTWDDNGTHTGEIILSNMSFTKSEPVGGDPETPDTIPTDGWVNIDYSGVGGWSGYDVDKTDGLTISHQTAKNGWACEGMSLSESYSWIKFTITNNSVNAATVSMHWQNKDNDKGVDKVYCDTDGVVSINALEDSARIELSGNQSVDIVLKVKNTATTNQLTIFLNSLPGLTDIESGSITFTGLQGIVK